MKHYIKDLLIEVRKKKFQFFQKQLSQFFAKKIALAWIIRDEWSLSMLYI